MVIWIGGSHCHGFWAGRYHPRGYRNAIEIDTKRCHLGSVRLKARQDNLWTGSARRESCRRLPCAEQENDCSKENREAHDVLADLVFSTLKIGKAL